MPLPPGLLLNPQTGELTGVPTVAGTFAVQLTVRDAIGNKREITDEVIINAYTPQTWSGDLGNLMATRVATGITVASAGGLAPFDYTVFSGNLPNGLTIHATTGVVSGTPTDSGGYAATLRVTDSLSQVVDYVIAGTVAANLTLDYPGSKSGTVSRGFNSGAPTTEGGTLPYTYSVESGSLPPGLSLDEDTGFITGIPTAVSAAAPTLRVTDAHGFTTDYVYTFDIVAMPTLSGSLARGMEGKAYSQGFTGALGHTPYVYSAQGLPAGLSIDSGTGVISGTPSTFGNFPVTVTLTDALGVAVERSQPIELAQALSITGDYSEAVTRGNVYPAFTISRTGGWSPWSFDVSAGALPTGLTLSSTLGTVTGTPTTQGNYTATLRVTDGDGSTATMAFDVDVAGDLVMTGGVPTRATNTVAFTGDTLGRTGGTAPYTWSISSGALPSGLSINTSTGDITGTPNATPGVYNFTVRLGDANLSFTTQNFSITVANALSLSGALPDGTDDVPYSASFDDAGGHPPYIWDMFSGMLPTGLTIDANTGVISGTPTTPGTYPFVVRIVDDAGNSATRSGGVDGSDVVIFAPPSITTTLDSPTEGSLTYNDGLSVSGGKTPFAWSVLGTLPGGLTMNSGTGVITGTVNPVAANTTYNFTVRLTDALGNVTESAQSIAVRRNVAHDIGGPGPATDMIRTVAYSSAFFALHGESPYTFARIAGAFPAGISLASNGALTGTPTTVSSTTATVRVTDALGVTADRSVSFQVWNVMLLEGDPPDGTVSVAYSYQLEASGGKSPFQYFLASGSMPTGLSLGSTGIISGTPTQSGTFNPTFRAYNALTTDFDDLPVSFQFNAFPTLTLNYGHGTALETYSGTVTAGSGWAPYSFLKHSGTLPPGLTLNASTGALTGTPTASGLFTFQIRMTDAKGNIVIKNGSINVAGPLTISGSYPGGKTGVAYSSAVSLSGGWAPRTVSHVAGTLPPGLSLSSAGVLSGTPNTLGTFNFTIRMTDGDSDTVDKAMSVQIITNAAFNVAAAPNPATDTAVVTGGASATVSATVTATASGGSGLGFTYSWSIVSRTILLGSGAFTISGANTRTLTASKASSVDYHVVEVWRCTARDSINNVDTIDVTIDLYVDQEAGGGDGGPGCVDWDSFLPDGRRVRDLEVGDLVACVDVTQENPVVEMVAVEYRDVSVQPRYQLVTYSASVIQSDSTPMVLRDGREVMTADMLGEEVLVNCNGELRFERVEQVVPVGPGRVIKIGLGNRMFFAGEKQSHTLATHNLKAP